MRPFSLALALSAALLPCARAGDFRRFEDAALHAVQFVDREEGWAVGDEGVVWHTIDGGKTWERQPTGVRASLRSVHFLDPYTGWVAGREEQPNGRGSVGVLLFTRDGGLKWQHVHRNTMPGLNQIRFLDAKTAFAAGDGSDQFPAGVFVTKDGGRSWQPVGGPRVPGWLAADFADEQTGTLIGPWSRLATFRKGVLGAADVDVLGARSLRGLHVNGQRAVAVGQGSLVLVSDTAGARWGYAELPLSAEARACWDFHAVHGRGDHLWVAGRPGSVVLHSGDRGQTWEVQTTGQPLPVNGAYFADENRGWLVGEFGSILATTDGGKTWRTQRRGGQRAALLFVHARPTGLPVDTIAFEGGQEGYLTAAVRVLSPDPAVAAPGKAFDPQRWAAAVGKSGGAAGEMLWQFPVPEHLAGADKKTLLKSWDRLHADRGAEQFLRQLVLALRTWRPAVVVTDHPDPAAAGGPAEALVAEALHEAFARAADPEAFPEQLKVLGLEPWQAGKLYGRWDGKAGCQVVLDANEVSPRLEATFRTFATPAAALLVDTVPDLPGQRFYRLLDSKIEGAANHRDLMDGISLSPGGTARRELPPLQEPSAELLKAIRDGRNIQALAEAQPGGLLVPDQVLAQLGPALNNLPDDQASAAAFAIGSQYARAGQWTLAREVFLYMVDRYPAHPLSADAYRWLIRYNSSSEARRRHELGQFLIVSNFTFQSTNNKLDAREQKTQTTEELKQRQLALLGERRETRVWNEGCLEVGNRLLAFGPLYATDPSVHFCLNAARRNLGDFDTAREWYMQFRNEHADGPWREAAAAEMWLNNRSSPAPRPTANCRQTSTRPFLDGKFDDPCWQNLKPVVLRNAVGGTDKDHPTEARLAFDKDFLYLALTCRHPEGQQLPPVKPRQRDADLRPYDRVSLLLDLDRDYSTYFHLQVDQRGCVCEDCWGDRTWNPRWFVAVKSDATSWQIEAAIPLIELTGDSLSAGRAWACNVVRILPGRGVQALSVPADVEPRPEGMGLLLFTPEQPPNVRQMLHAN